MIKRGFCSVSEATLFTAGKVFFWICVLFCVVDIVGFSWGSSRRGTIRHYNQHATKWMQYNRTSFSNASFYLTSSSGKAEMVRNVNKPGEAYPVRDSCNRPFDPRGGCVLTDALSFRQYVLLLDGQNTITLFNKDGSILSRVGFKSNITYVFDDNDLGCHYSPSDCQYACTRKRGMWNSATNLCRVELHANEICLRVRESDGTWIVDDEKQWRLPKNRKFDLYDSDGHGCTYNNNWHSIVYNFIPQTDIRVVVRHSLDSYIAASAYTGGCSSTNLLESNCFGLTRFESRFGFFLSFCICFVLCIAAVACLQVCKRRFWGSNLDSS
ncbi:hypothetical protein WA538_001845 [Blastocystis sp. DL]